MAAWTVRICGWRSTVRSPGPGARRSGTNSPRQLGADVQEVAAGLDELARGRHLALGDDGQIVMAHPFSAVPLGFSVMGARTLWWGGCAWDSFALPHLLPGEDEVLVATRCPACGRPHAWSVGRQRPPDGGQVAHFLVPAARMWDDVVHTCAHQRLFCSEDCVERLAGGHRFGPRLRDGPRHAVAAGRALVRRAGWTAATSGASRPRPRRTCAASGWPGRSGAAMTGRPGRGH